MSVQIVQIDGTIGVVPTACGICKMNMPSWDAVCFSVEPPRGNVRWKKIKPMSKDEYSKFILENLFEETDRNHVLIVQQDGFILFPELWDGSWLRFDYIGAPWPFYPYVGNGGFSLRSRKLLEITKGLYQQGENEDTTICVRNRKALEMRGIVFAPANIAEIFSQELIHPRHRTFGFHSPV